VRLYINGNTQFSSLDEDRYHEILVHSAMEAAPSRKNILILGGGDGLALRELNKYQNVESITLVDLDPEMVKIASTNPYLTKLNKNAFNNAKVVTQALQSDGSVVQQGVYLVEEASTDLSGEWVASVEIFNVDADMFLREPPAKPYDIVFIDLPDPSSIELSKLYSKQFYMSLKRHIAPGAYVSIQSTSPYHAKEAFLSIGATMEAAGFNTLPFRLNIPSFGDWGYYLAWTNDEKPEQLKSRLSSVREFDVELAFLTPELLASSFAFGKGELEIDDVCVNTIMEPCLLDRYVDKSWITE